MTPGRGGGRVPQVRLLQSPQYNMEEINKALRDIQNRLLQVQPVSGSSSGGVIYGLHGSRSQHPPGESPGSIYIESDRGDVAYVSVFANGSWVWQYSSGIYTAALTSLPGDLGTLDTGFVFRSTTVGNHRYYWSGTSWVYDGDLPGVVIAWGLNTTPLSTLYHLLDGATITIANPATPGSSTSVVLIDARSNGTDFPFVMSGGYASAASGATRAKWESSAKTGNENATHTHDTDVPAALAYAGGSDPGAVAGTFTSTTESAVHQHPLTDADAQIKIFGESASQGGLPLRIAMQWYVRI